ncbi:MAG: hypothetical protein CME06_05485 [Gemmatimonadetes bacterium]|nr:hypothetical protein [Gemmatimonadota bacterium]
MNSPLAISPTILALLVAGGGIADTFDHEDLPQGNAGWRRKNLHSGNKIKTVFYNFGLVANPGEPSGEWPIGNTENDYVGDVTPLVGVEYVNKVGDLVHTVVTCDGPRGNSDGPGGGVFWGFEPIPGFLAEDQDGVAMSHLPSTWPGHWPDKPASWNGFWNGFFGRGVQNADQESFFYVDDANDAEFNVADDGTVLWQPSPDAPSRAGLGLLVKVRGFQWSHFLAEDVIFWLYEVTNVSVHDYDKVAFGMVVGTLSGGRTDSDDDLAFFDLEDDMTYSWDSDDNVDFEGWVPVSETIEVGYAGYAFLESPGNPFNGIDDDGDGEEGSPLIDAGMLSGEVADNGIDDNGNGLIDEGVQHIGLAYADNIDNDADGRIDEMIDERRDDGIDNDLDWDPLLHDSGADGVPGTADEGEGDGVPTAGERNFDATDVDESDQIGLTSFDYFSPPSDVRMNDDDGLWERLQPGRFEVVPDEPADGDFIYGSGYFPLKVGQTQRFSMALVFGEDFEDIVDNKRTAQQIYDDNYNFARPPANPTVWATADSGKVTLYWDGSESENSFDDVLGFDFEGYKIYKSTEPFFNESFTITDAKGRKTFNDPLAQFDLINGEFGFFETPIEGRGIQFFLGKETGLRYSIEDTDVVNGRTYYYAVVAYDHGGVELNIQPAENTKSITELDDGSLIFDDNTVAVTPGVKAAGYVGSSVVDFVHEGEATGDLQVEIVDPARMVNRSYEVTFEDQSFWEADTLHPRATASYTVRLIDADSVVVDSSTSVEAGPSDDFFAGMRLVLENDVAVETIDSLSGWSGAVAGAYGVSSRVFNYRRTNGHAWPGIYELRVSSEIDGRSTEYEIDDIFGSIHLPAVDTRFKVLETTGGSEGELHFAYWELGDLDDELDPGDQIILLRPDPADSSTLLPTWSLAINEGGGEPPGNGAAYRFKTTIPFRGGVDGDTYTFRTVKPTATSGAGTFDMDAIKVVPNPYVAGNSLEPKQLFGSERGERRLFFTHLPPRASIRIYTLRGELVDTIKHDGGVELSGSASWDLRSRDNLEIAYGVYLFHVDAPGYGEQIGKFAVIK